MGTLQNKMSFKGNIVASSEHWAMTTVGTALMRGEIGFTSYHGIISSERLEHGRKVSVVVVVVLGGSRSQKTWLVQG